MAIFTQLVSSIGGLWLSHRLFKVLRFIYVYTRPSSLPRYCYSSKENSPPWALVTGASDGIGFAYAHELANRGFNVVLHGRNVTKLEGKKKELTAEFPQTRFRVVTADANLPGAEMTRQIGALVGSLQDIHLTVLINNVGGPPPGIQHLYNPLEKCNPSDTDGYININSTFPVQLTAAILPLLLRHNGPSLILNMSSFSSVGIPCLTVYSAAKAFIETWTISLAREMKATGRTNTEVLGIITAKVTGVSYCKEKPSLFMPDTKTFARASLDRVGCGEMLLAGCWGHGLQGAILDLMPEFMKSRSLETSMKSESEKEFKRD